MKSAGKARSNGLYRHIRTSKEIIRNLLNDSSEILYFQYFHSHQYLLSQKDSKNSLQAGEFDLTDP